MHSDCSAGHGQAPSPGTRDGLILLKIMNVSSMELPLGRAMELEGEC